MITRAFKLTLLFAFVICNVLNGWSQEAPQSFDMQNGLLAQRQFTDARKAFEEIETPQKGLGIISMRLLVQRAISHQTQRVCPEEVARSPKSAQDSSASIKAVGNAVPEIKALSDKQNVRDRSASI